MGKLVKFRMLRILVAIPVIVVLFFSLNPSQGFAQAPVEITLNAFVGFENTYKEGEWFPVRILLENNGPGVNGVLIVQLTDAGSFLSPVSVNVELPATSRKEVTAYVYPANTYATQLTVSLIQNRNTLVEKAFTLKRLSKTDYLYGILAQTPSAYNVLSTLDPPNGSANVVALTLDDLPELVQGYGAFSTLVFSGIDTGDLSERQVGAIEAWTAQGGQIILTGGQDWESTAFGFTSSELLPIDLESAQTLDEVVSALTIRHIQAFSGSLESINPDNQIIIAVGIPKPQTETILSIPDDPKTTLITRLSYGAGEVLYISYDPSLPPFRGWIGAENLYRILLRNSFPQPDQWRGILDWNMAQQAAQTMPSLGLPSILLICGFLFFYILILGPVNFLILRSIKKRELGWLTIPGFVILFSVLVFLGGNLSRGQKPVLHRLAIVRGWSGSTYARVDGVLGIYSPNRSKYEVVSKYPTILHPIPNQTLFQTNAFTIHETAESISIPEVQVDIGGVVPLAYESNTTSPLFSQDLTISIDDSGILLEGNIQNMSGITLNNAVLVTPARVTNIGEFTPGEVIKIQENIGTATTGSAIANNSGLRTVPGLIAQPNYSGNIFGDILGTYNYYTNREMYRKYALLVAAFSYSPGSLNQNNEVYLIGWSQRPIADIQLAKINTNFDDLTLYIMAFYPPVEFRGERWTLTPGFFHWSSIEPSMSDVSPYNQYLYNQSSYGLNFSPRQDLAFSRVLAVVFHLKSSYETGPITGARFELWDFQNQVWEQLDIIDWGDIEIQDPGKYVANEYGSDQLGDYIPGTIRLQIHNTTDYLQIDTSDFTLIVER
jgi:hypothetical protein